MKRPPLLATALVTLAVGAMIALGLWQLLVRLPEKEALLATLAANRARPPIAYPTPATGDALLFRRTTAACAHVTGWESQSGRNAQGGSGWRVIARCTGVDGSAGPIVQIGIAAHPLAHPDWAGGTISGYIGYAPDHEPAIARAFGGAPRALMLVSDMPAPGLMANAPPDLDAVPNNHLAYGVQWFLFAGVAGVIYALALRRR